MDLCQALLLQAHWSCCVDILSSIMSAHPYLPFEVKIIEHLGINPFRVPDDNDQ